MANGTPSHLEDDTVLRVARTHTDPRRRGSNRRCWLNDVSRLPSDFHDSRSACLRTDGGSSG